MLISQDTFRKGYYLPQADRQRCGELFSGQICLILFHDFGAVFCSLGLLTLNSGRRAAEAQRFDTEIALVCLDLAVRLKRLTHRGIMCLGGRIPPCRS